MRKLNKVGRTSLGLRGPLVIRTRQCDNGILAEPISADKRIAADVEMKNFIKLHKDSLVAHK